MVIGRREAGDAAAQGETGADQVAVGEGLAVLILDDQAAGAKAFAGLDQGVEHAARNRSDVCLFCHGVLFPVRLAPH